MTRRGAQPMATRPGSGAWRRLADGRTLPVVTVVLIILALWYAAARSG